MGVILTSMTRAITIFCSSPMSKCLADIQACGVRPLHFTKFYHLLTGLPTDVQPLLLPPHQQTSVSLYQNTWRSSWMATGGETMRSN